MNFNPISTVVGIIAAVALLGYIISYFRASVNFSGYQEVAADAQSVARAMKGEIFRDGDDLVISGNYGKLPAIVRFSYADNTPGLNINMKAPSTFRMSVVPKGARASEGRVLVRTPDEMFDARFVTRTDHPTQAKMFLTGKPALEQLQKLCCSSKTFFSVSSGNLELSELVIPTPYTARHIDGHLDSMSKLAQSLSAMPGADEVKITPFKRERNHLITAAMAVLAITGVVVVASAVHERSTAANTVADRGPKIPAGVSPVDFPHMRALDGWRLATSDDFDADSVGWARAQGVEPSGHLLAQFNPGDRPGSAYILIQTAGEKAGMRRVVMLEGPDASRKP